MAKSPPFHPIRDILRKMISNPKWDIQIKKYSLWEEWKSLVGEKVAAHAKPERWMNHILVVAVDDSSWMTELRMMEREIAARIKKKQPRLTGIRWVLKS